MNRLAFLALVLSLAACGGPDTAPAGTAERTRSTAEPAAFSEPASEPDSTLPLVTVYKSPTCGCCSAWVQHLEASGFTVETVDVDDLAAVKRQYGIPDSLASCHTAVVGGYVVEGHVPAEDVRLLLAEHPDAGGLAVPGMPVGSPGMETPDQPAQPYAVLLVSAGSTSVYAQH